MNTCTMKDVYDKFGLEATTRDFIGHSMALYPSDEYISSRGMTKDTVNRIRLYANSMARYGKSPYIYPLYGLGELPQGFARLSAIYGGTYMLNTNIDEIKYGADGKVEGITATMQDRDDKPMNFTTKTKMIIGDPSYFRKPSASSTTRSHQLATQTPSSSSSPNHRSGANTTFTSPWYPQPIMSARKATTLPSCRPSPKRAQTTTSSCNPV